MNAPGSDFDQTTNTIRKIARIWSLVILALALIILIAEILESLLNSGSTATYPWYENLIPMTLFLGVVGLGLSWRWEGFGSVLSIVCVIANYVMYIAFGGRGRGLFIVPIILFPVLIPGVLFLISWLRTQRNINPNLA